MKICWTLLINSEMHIKPQYHLTSIRMAIIKKETEDNKN